VLTSDAKGRWKDTGLRQGRLPPGSPEMQVTEVEFASHDGVKVPLAILHRKGLALDGNNATLLDGYGAYGFTTQAWYDPKRLAWLERGGVLAFVNPRGSGAYGDAWHRAGFKTTKANTWKDGIAAAHWLIDQGYARPALLGVQGGSAGGIFVGRVITEAPQLFAAAILNVPDMDLVRAERSANGITNISEFGTVANEAEFHALLDMSTYHHIEDGIAYPAALFIHGLNDPRVDAWHSGRRRPGCSRPAAAASPCCCGWTNRPAAASAARPSRPTMRADEWAFMLWQFGILSLKAEN
jgi:prolyl oligopeptidase